MGDDFGSVSYKDQSFTPSWKKQAPEPLRRKWWFWVLLLVLLPLILVGVAMVFVMLVLALLV